MRAHIKLTPPLKREITRDWNNEFPSLGIYEPMWLLRRIGPIVMGICLDRDSSNECYLPTFHVHNLCSEISFVSLSLHICLTTKKGAEESINTRDHSSRYVDAAQRLSEQALLPFSGDLTLDQVLLAYHSYRMISPPAYSEDPHLLSNPVLICSWAGQLEMARSLLVEAQEIVKQWHPRIFKDYGDRVAWADSLAARFEDIDKIRRTADEHILAMNLTTIPNSQLVI